MNIHDVKPELYTVVAFWEENSGLVRRKSDGQLDVIFGVDDKDRQIEILKGHIASKHNALLLVWDSQRVMPALAWNERMALANAADHLESIVRTGQFPHWRIEHGSGSWTIHLGSHGVSGPDLEKTMGLLNALIEGL